MTAEPRPADPAPAPARTRLVAWDDPAAGAAAGAAMSGLDYLRAMAAGALPPPPIMVTLGIGVAEVEPGRVVFTAVPAEYHYNPIGSVHGGLFATLADSATACAIHTTLPAGTGYTTLDLKVTFLRGMTAETGPVRCEGTVVHVGGRVAAAEARLTDAAGTLLGHATATCLVFRPSR